MTNKKTILFLHSNPSDTKNLWLNDEVKKIEENLYKSENRDLYDIQKFGDVKRTDLVSLLNRHQPYILHISCHGDDHGNLIFSDDSNTSLPLNINSFLNALRHEKNHLKCVILNACYSSSSLKKTGYEIPIIIGMKRAIEDPVAKNFSNYFYNTLFGGKNILDSFEKAKDHLDDSSVIPEIIIRKSNEDNLVQIDNESSDNNILNNINKRINDFQNDLQTHRELGNIEEVMSQLKIGDQEKNFELDPSFKEHIHEIITDYNQLKDDYLLKKVNLEEYLSIKLKIVDNIDDFFNHYKKIYDQIKKEDSEETSRKSHVVAAQLSVLSDIHGDKFKEIKIQATELLDNSNEIRKRVNRSTALAVSLTCLTLVSLGSLLVLLNKNPENKNIAIFINISLQLSLIIYMISYYIKPNIGISQFERMVKTDDYLQKVFNSNLVEMFKYYLRATSAIKQFARWWRGLGYSFLSLYLFYYLVAISAIYHPNFEQSFLYRYEHLIDISLNGIEAFFLYVLYKLLTDKTLKENFKIKNGIPYENSVKFRKPLIVGIVTLLVFVLFGAYTHTYGAENTVLKGTFHLVSRIISGVLVAIGLCMVVGRLDSKFIGAKGYILVLLYLYAALQAMFILFDKTIISDLFGISFEGNIHIESSFKNIKSTVLYFMLILKAVFIFFVHDIYNKNYLFYYFLIGSKLNDNITNGKIGNEYVKFDGKEKAVTVSIPTTD